MATANVYAVLARVEVDDLDAALPLYVELAGQAQVNRFAFRDLELARVGPFLLLAGPAQSLAAVRRTASLLVHDIEAARRSVAEAGGEVLEGPASAPNGPRMIARHPDGAVLEYLQPAYSPG